MTVSGRQTERGHETPFVRQFSVFLPNRVGQLAKLLELLAEEEVEVAALSIVDSTDWAVVRMVFTDIGKAREKLSANGIAFTECNVLAVVIDEMQTFGQVCKALVGAELNVQFAYPLVIRHADRVVMVVHADDYVLGAHVLRKHEFTLLDHEDL